MAKKKVSRRGRVGEGRPTKYTEDMPERAYKVLSKGEGMASVAVELGVSKETVYQWASEKEEFSAAIKKGRAASEKVWEEIGRQQALGNSNGSTAAWIFMMKNKFKWTNREEVTQDVGANTASLLEQIIEESLKK
jgi:hypothetical protein